MEKLLSKVNVTNQALSILSQLSDHAVGLKSHQLIRGANELCKSGLSANQWLNVLDALVHRGLLVIDSKRAELKLSDRGRRFLADPGEFLVDIDQPPTILQPEVQTQFDQTLYDQLRWKRKKMAEEAEVPPYRIFTNRPLAEMATYRLETLEELQALHGVGSRLANKYGQSFLSVIQYYLKRVA